MSVCSKCSLLSGTGLWDELITRPESRTDCGASLGVLWKPQELGVPGPSRAAAKEEVVKNMMSRDSSAISYLTNLYALMFRQLM